MTFRTRSGRDVLVTVALISSLLVMSFPTQQAFAAPLGLPGRGSR
jgi:hypothetical protein